MPLDRARQESAEDSGVFFGQTDTSEEQDMLSVSQRLRSPEGFVRYIINTCFSDLASGVGYDERDDLVQEGLMAVRAADLRIIQLQSQGEWDFNLESTEVSYLFASVRYAIINRIKYHSRKQVESLEEKKEIAGFEPSADTDIEKQTICRIEREERKARLREAIEVLTAHQSEVITRVEQGKTYLQIGEELGISSGAVKDVVRTAVTKIREHLGLDTDKPIQLSRIKRKHEKSDNPRGKTKYGTRNERNKARFNKRYKEDHEFAERLRKKARERQRRIRAARKAGKAKDV